MATIEGPAEVPEVDSIDAVIDVSGVIQFARGRTVGTITVTTYDRSEFSQEEGVSDPTTNGITTVIITQALQYMPHHAKWTAGMAA